VGGKVAKYLRLRELGKQRDNSASVEKKSGGLERRLGHQETKEGARPTRSKEEKRGGSLWAGDSSVGKRTT